MPPARRRVLGAGLAGLGVVLAGGWAWTRAQAPGAVAMEVPQPESTVPPQVKTPEVRADPAPIETVLGPTVVDAPLRFVGPIINDTMGQSGRVTLLILPQALPGAIKARFTASAGLVGSGELSGRVSESGRLTVAGTLMMGRNPFACDLRGVIAGNTLTGSASFVRGTGGAVAHSRFTLTRA